MRTEAQTAEDRNLEDAMSDETKNAGAAPSGAKDDAPKGKKAREAEDHVNPSAPEDANTTPGSTGEK